LLVQAEIQNGVWSKWAINADVMSETYEHTATGKRQIRRFQRPHSGLTTPQQETLRISTKDLYCKKREALTYIFAADSIGLRTLLITQLSLNTLSLKLLVRKPSFTWNSHSRSLGHSFCNQSQADKG